jgi:hypothetical protein
MGTNRLKLVVSNFIATEKLFASLIGSNFCKCQAWLKDKVVHLFELPMFYQVFILRRRDGRHALVT